jgi:maltooligosyltrehalose trehalohydrolase
MHVFEVWAPRAGTMEVKIGDKLFPMEKEPRGYWSAAVEEARPGIDYGFVIDGVERPRLAGVASFQRPYL